VQLSTFGTRSGTEKELTYKVAYKSSDEKVATVDASGLATVIGAGDVSFTSQVGAVLSHPVEAQIACTGYPAGTQALGYGNTMPALTWPAVWPDGNRFDLSMGDLRCQSDWKDVHTLAFVISAGWCGACTAYAQQLQNQVDDLAARGMKIAIIEMEDYNGVPADSAFAFEHLGKITSRRPGIALGDADVKPTAHFVRDSNYISYFPTTFVVRTSDMKIIADQKRANIYLPLADIADHPDADWSNGKAFLSHCKPGEEEKSEPNNVAADAAGPIGVGTYHGGICDDITLDIYEVDPGGTWTATLTYDASQANLAIWVWDAEHDQIAQIGGQIYGSSTGSGHETLTFTGKTLVAVQGVDSTSAAYTLSISK